MRITFFGTSHGVPEAHRRCSSALITLGSGENARRYIIDMGLNAIDEMRTRNLPVDSVKAVFITHMHGDHTDGLIQFVDLCSWYFKTANPTIFLPELECFEPMKAWIHATGVEVREEIHFEPVSEGAFYDDGFLKVTAARTRHCRTSYGYLLEAEGKRVLFSGDLSCEPANDFPASFAKDEPLDLAVCECAHFEATKYLPVFEACRLRSIVFNHYVNKHIGSIFDVAKTLKPLPVALANDGMEIEL